MAGSISILGLGSEALNADTIDKLKEADKEILLGPANRRAEENIQQREDFTTMIESLKGLQDSASIFADELSYLKRTTTYNGSGGSVMAEDGVSPQSGTIEVQQLAQRSVVQSKGFATQNDIKSKNIAAVMVTAKLPAFGRQGDRIDIMVSSIGDAKSLEGGTLLLTPLKGLDGRIYAVSQGPITVGGFNSGGGVGQKNHTTAGRVLGGAIIEREVAYDLYNKEYATLSLESSSFENAIRIQDAINAFYGVKVAVALDPRTIKLKKPDTMSMIEFLAAVEDCDIETDIINKIIVQERTGTVISGVDISVKPVNVTHGNFSISIDESFLDNNQENKTITVANVTTALQKMGASAKDIISILEAIKKAGALDAELEVI